MCTSCKKHTSTSDFWANNSFNWLEKSLSRKYITHQIHTRNETTITKHN